MEEKFFGKRYETIACQGYLYMDHELDLEKIKIIDDILLAAKRIKKFNTSFIDNCKDEVLHRSELSYEVYNKLVKIYYKWGIETVLEDIYRHRNCEIC